MIRIDIQRKRFEHHAVLGPIAFDIAAGETVALTGPSGIGKTTLLRLVAGIDPDFEGQIVRPDRLAIVFQEPTLLPWRSAFDNLALIHGDLSKADIDAALSDVGLDGKGDLFPGQLSLGQQRRLSLARAFAGQPEFLIMDEPFVSLDTETAETMLTLTEDLITRHRPATLFVTHSKPEARRLSDRILTLVPGPSGAVLG
ncbi:MULTISPECIES: ABC transporter ATP-binding protein [unclassified Ruegeria]|uniref:ABC transporter ATP-binding protein n=1 Tax=unclassified Ruegeria TaxID=2625375 RepID=UPI0014913F8C|nr:MULTISPECIES: ATP-binding cassette domain-containing protein [unclassified Ruegeria]NOC45665.1 ATP-binding cassette domain-containing protein [Ruegeria sp. HKCCD7559]NOD85674.1 ATP-binding cassette domain-containing protein [Ruegeria sp. HKCCD6119]